MKIKEIFSKIDKSKYPKVARKWSWSVFFFYPTFVIANKLWHFLSVYIIINLVNFVLLALLVDKYLVDLISVGTLAILIFFTFYLMLYGRAAAWDKLGYKDNEKDITKFKLRQRLVLYFNILIIGAIVIFVIYSLNTARIYSNL